MFVSTSRFMKLRLAMIVAIGALWSKVVWFGSSPDHVRPPVSPQSRV
jgi:hypothetical protein